MPASIRKNGRFCRNSALSSSPKSIRYPDIIVDPAGEAPKDLIAEVLSPSSERIDPGDKSSEYLRLRSLAAYCLFAQDAIKAWVWARGPGGFPPGPEVFEGESAVIRIEALALDLPLKEIYTRVRMDERGSRCAGRPPLRSAVARCRNRELKGWCGREDFEPPRVAPLAPQASASTNSATTAVGLSAGQMARR